jgi:hypothetical protein
MQIATMLLPIFIMFIWMSSKLFNSLRTMNIYMGVGVVLSRYENPALFWLVIAFQCLVIGVLFGIMYAPTFVLPNQIMS